LAGFEEVEGVELGVVGMGGGEGLRAQWASADEADEVGGGVFGDEEDEGGIEEKLLPFGNALGDVEGVEKGLRDDAGVGGLPAFDMDVCYRRGIFDRCGSDGDGHGREFSMPLTRFTMEP